MAHAEVQSLGVYKFVLNWLSIMWLKKVRYQPEAATLPATVDEMGDHCQALAATSESN